MRIIATHLKIYSNASSNEFNAHQPTYYINPWVSNVTVLDSRILNNPYRLAIKETITCCWYCAIFISIFCELLRYLSYPYILNWMNYVVYISNALLRYIFYRPIFCSKWSSINLCQIGPFCCFILMKQCKDLCPYLSHTLHLVVW